MKKIAIVTDAWHPQINGVVTTLGRTIADLESFGYQVKTITPQLFSSFPCPTYPEISLSLTGAGAMRQKLISFDPASLFASADVFVFPSRTDTFGVVLLEAMASGVPVAAYPVMGPVETVRNGINGYLDNDLRKAALQALKVSPQSCRKFAMNWSWKACSKQFLNNLILHGKPLSSHEEN